MVLSSLRYYKAWHPKQNEFEYLEPPILLLCTRNRPRAPNLWSMDLAAPKTISLLSVLVEGLVLLY